MENTEISGHVELLLRIRQLKVEKLRQENELKYTFREFANSLEPLSVVKRSLHKMTQDKEVQFDLAKAGLNLSTNFIIGAVLGKYRGIKGFLSSVLLEKISTVFINNNVSEIIAGIDKLVYQNSEKETNQ